MKKVLLLLTALAVLPVYAVNVRNAGFDRSGGKPPVQKSVDQWRQKGLICPDANQWPHYWYSTPSKGKSNFHARTVSEEPVSA